MTRRTTESTIFSRFSGACGKELIVETLKDQRTVLGSASAASELGDRGMLACFWEGEFLIREGDWSNEIIFILAGRVQITITGFKVAERRAGQHIGEIALIDPAQPRSASVVAMEPTVGLVVSERDFAAIASNHPHLWRQIAKELAERLRQRSKFVRPSNPHPLVFVACAAEALPVASAIQAHFEIGKTVVEIWTDGVFKPSQGTMESLEDKLSSADFCVAIFSADDKVESRGLESVAPRDNTVFELGLFAGAISRQRSFFAVQKDRDIKIPTDLAGITSLRFTMAGRDGVKPDIAEACALIEERIAALGPR